MITLTAIQEAITELVMTHEGLSAGALATVGRQPPWRVYATLRALRDKGILIDDASRKNSTHDATFWYVRPEHRAALGLSPLDPQFLLDSFIAKEIEEGTGLRERIFSDLLAEQKRAKATIKFEAVPCKHCGQRHCLPKRGRRRKLASI